MPNYKNVAIPLGLHRQVAILAARLGRTIGGQGGVVAELLEEWLDQPQTEQIEETRDADTNSERDTGSIDSD